MLHGYKELRAMKDNIERREWLNKMTKKALVDYYTSQFKTITQSNKEWYMKKTKKYLIDMIMNHYDSIRRAEAMEHIKVWYRRDFPLFYISLGWVIAIN